MNFQYILIYSVTISATIILLQPHTSLDIGYWIMASICRNSKRTDYRNQEMFLDAGWILWDSGAMIEDTLNPDGLGLGALGYLWGRFITLCEIT